LWYTYSDKYDYHAIEDSAKVLLPCSSSLREEARRRETPAIAEHPESLTPTLSLRERE
jgi:hypothetical protein